MSGIDDWQKVYYDEDKRGFKKERKIASKTDRSKYKKTDREKFQKKETLHENIKAKKEDFLTGRVISIQSQGVTVDVDGKIYNCQLKGLLKREKTEDKNLLAVGDFVLVESVHPGEGMIVHVEPRKSVLSRADNLSRRKQQLIAANIDQVLITVSVVNPLLKPFLVDRYIIASKKGGMVPIIVVNKIDLLKTGQDPFYEEFVTAYRKSGIQVIEVSAATLEGTEALKEVMKDKASVFSGQSGVGKSSLINVVTGMALRVGKMVEKTGKGAHTTTLAQLIPLSFGGFCIDTPGIKSFGVWNLSKNEIAGFFPDIEEKRGKCKFPDCTHTHEQECAVIRAVKLGKISGLRYESYCYLMVSVEENHLRR